MIRLGVVLSTVPAFSETFFDSKIDLLVKGGVEVTMLARGKKWFAPSVKVVNPWPVPINLFLRAICVIWIVPITWLRAPVHTWRFWQLEIKEGTTLKERLRLVYINSHILVRNFDWLSFGFATQALNRECVAKAIGAKMAVSIRGYDIQVYPLKYPDCYQKVWNYTDKLHSLSQALVRDAQRWGLPSDLPVSIIPPAIDTLRFGQTPKKGWGAPLRFVTVARLHWIKGLSYSIRAMTLLKQKGHSFTYHIIGEGEAREQLLFEIDRENLTDCIFLEGRQPAEKIMTMLNQCDVYFQPSLSEGFCNAVLEAQVSGAACIVSAAGGLVENVIDGVSGWTVPPGNPEAISQKVIEILELPQAVTDGIRLAARDHVLTNYNLDLHATKWKDFYKS
jgi:colanic acid/amylovoran biosynthesis glycosyltransferase